MHLDVWTLAIQAVNFLVLAWLLKHFLYRPVLAAMERRRQASLKLEADARSVREQARADRDALEAERAELERSRQAVLAEARQQAEAVKSTTLDQARREADAVAAQARRQLEVERDEALAELKRRGTELGISVAERLLRASRSPGVTQEFLKELVRELPAPAPNARPRNGAVLRVVTAPPLLEEEQRYWRRELERAAPGVQVEFAVDEALIAGAELHLPDAVVGLSWRDALEAARKELSRDANAR